MPIHQRHIVPEHDRWTCVLFRVMAGWALTHLALGCSTDFPAVRRGQGGNSSADGGGQMAGTGGQPTAGTGGQPMRAASTDGHPMAPPFNPPPPAPLTP